MLQGVATEVTGGGVSQVSSTIYDAVLGAGLEVVERHQHEAAVDFIPLGRDATVRWGHLDFRFRNSTEFPLRIDALLEGNTLTIVLIGTAPE